MAATISWVISTGAFLPGTSAVVMTTWHDHEPLSETLEFFWTCATPSDGKPWGSARIVLVVDSAHAADEIRRWASHH